MELTPLAKRLARVARSPETDWKMLVENVPVWPEPPRLPSQAWGDGDAEYAPSQGVEALREALRERAGSQGVPLGTDSFLVTNGAFDALGMIARHVQRSGVRRAICAGPVLWSVAQLFETAGMHLEVEDWSTLLVEQGWRRKRLGPGDVVYVNTPHNPTGVCLDDDVTRELLREQVRCGFSLIFDLVYDAFVFGPRRFATPLALVGDWRGVYGINSFSKNYGAPGLRVGWAIAEPAVVEELTVRIEFERIAVATGAQRRAIELCKHGNTALVERVERGHRQVQQWAHDQGIATGPGRNGTQLWLDLEVGDTEKFSDVLMAEERVVVTTGANYHPHEPGHIRIPAGVPSELLDEALPAIGRVRDRMWRSSLAREGRL
jgi:aspartate aminotransferase